MNKKKRADNIVFIIRELEKIKKEHNSIRFNELNKKIDDTIYKGYQAISEIISNSKK